MKALGDIPAERETQKVGILIAAVDFAIQVSENIFEIQEHIMTELVNSGKVNKSQFCGNTLTRGIIVILFTSTVIFKNVPTPVGVVVLIFTIICNERFD